MPKKTATTPSTLTDREMEVARMLAIGKNNHEIGKALDISVKTVDTHRLHVLKKLGLRNNVELCLHMVRNTEVNVDGVYPQKIG